MIAKTIQKIASGKGAVRIALEFSFLFEKVGRIFYFEMAKAIFLFIFSQ